MNPILLVHIVAGSLGLVTGFVTLYAAKGAPIHRKVGMAFVAAMLTMTPTGFVVAITSRVWAEVNIPAAIVTAYLVITAMSFFIGQSDEFPKAMRIMPLLAIPPLAVLATMLYWVWRVRLRRSPRGLTVVRAAA